MWVKKTEFEKIEEERIEKENWVKSRFKKSVYIGFWCFLIIVILFLLFAITIGIPESRHIPGSHRHVFKINELSGFLPSVLKVAMISGILTFLVSFYSRNKKTSTLMCDKCHASKNYDIITKCECGGNFINFSNFKWIDD